jgi:hypothetical protein
MKDTKKQGFIGFYLPIDEALAFKEAMVVWKKKKNRMVSVGEVLRPAVKKFTEAQEVA